MAYNRALDLILAAVSMQQSGKIEHAARLFERAASHESAPSALNIINAFNEKQTQTASKSVKASASRTSVQAARQRLAVTAAAWPFRVNATVGNVGDELHVDVEENDLREVQEADFEEDFELMGLDDASDEELIMSAAEDDDEDADEAEEEEEEEEDDKTSESARFTRTLRNLQASRELAAKKPAAKKKAPFGGKKAPPFKKK